MLITLSTRNPLYLAVVLLVVLIVREPLRTAVQRGIAILKFALIAIPISAVFNTLSVHFGDTVLFSIPGQIPLFSGAITLESGLYGATNGLVLTTVLAIFSTLNLAIAPRDWMRIAPRTFQSVGMTMSIALSLVPQIHKRIREVREAQAIRGHRVRGLRDWLPLWVPLLTGGLEQSMQLSEAMVARGFGAVRSQATSSVQQGTLIAGLVLLIGGWVTQTLSTALNTPGWVTMLGGALVLCIGLIRGARISPRTTYREQRFGLRDGLVALACVCALAATVLPTLFGQDNLLAYSPYPTVVLPPFDLRVGMGVLLLIGPAFVGGR